MDVIYTHHAVKCFFFALNKSEIWLILSRVQYKKSSHKVFCYRCLRYPIKVLSDKQMLVTQVF